MFRLYYILLALALTNAGFSQTLENSMLLDLGPNNTTDGSPTESPDANGNHWNNMTNPVATSINIALSSKENEDTGISVSIAQGLNKNGINHGGLLAPPPALGEYAINTATQDYFFTSNSGAIVFKNLNADRGYNFKFFASRENEEVRVTQYEVLGANSQVLQLQSSGPGIGESGYNGNTSSLVESDIIYPDESQEIHIVISKTEGQFAYLNFLEINEYSDVNFSAVESIEITSGNLDVNGGFVKLEALISPPDATFQGLEWTVDERDIAYVSSDGRLHAYKDGTVQVTVRSKEPNSSVTASQVVTISNQATKRIMVDLGSDNGIDGNTTMGAEATDQWTNHTNNEAGSPPTFAQNVDGEESEISLSTLTNMGVRGIADGGLLEPSSDLGELAVATATQDYFSSQNSATIVLKNLRIGNAYRFDCLGSRAATSTRSTRYTFNGLNSSTGTLITSGTDLGGQGQNLNIDLYYTSNLVFPDSNGEIELIISISQGQFAYLNAMRITEYEDVDICPTVDENLVAVMGSSVARGQGAPSDMGYAFMYNELLESRHDDASSEFRIENISVGGNNTIKVLDRWESDLVPLCGRYVIYGLSLGNEGIANNGQAAFDQFQSNMELLIAQAKERNIVPVVMNNYPREDFGPVQYQFIKDMNLLIHQWEVPSFNALGAIDDGTGKWVQDYQEDFGHPNQEGHREFFLNMVPSLFDALEEDKQFPKLQETEGYPFTKDTETYLSFQPDHLMHSFTVVFDLKTSDVGTLLSLESESSSPSLAISDEGKLEYTSSTGELISDLATVNDGEWHSVALTHYYAMGKTFLYTDGEKISGDVSENLAPSLMQFQSDFENDLDLILRDIFIYRAGMNNDEIDAIQQGLLLKSSLEIYAPLSEDLLSKNLAQSTETLILEGISSTTVAAEKSEISIYPNPASDRILVQAEGMRIDSISIRDGQSRLFMSSKEESLDIRNLSPGVYYIHVVAGEKTLVEKFVKL